MFGYKGQIMPSVEATDQTKWLPVITDVLFLNMLTIITRCFQELSTDRKTVITNQSQNLPTDSTTSAHSPNYNVRLAGNVNIQTYDKINGNYSRRMPIKPLGSLSINRFEDQTWICCCYRCSVGRLHTCLHQLLIKVCISNSKISHYHFHDIIFVYWFKCSRLLYIQ